MVLKWFIRFQLSMFLLLVLFMVSLVFPSWGIKIPTGLEGEWFTKLWEIYLVVSNFTGLALLVKAADTEITEGVNKNGKETVSSPGPLDPSGL